VRLREVIDDPASRKIYLALEYMENGELIWRESDDTTIPILTMDESRNVFRDVVSGLDYRKSLTTLSILYIDLVYIHYSSLPGHHSS
jgi:serine/threonine protein kinase